MPSERSCAPCCERTGQEGKKIVCPADPFPSFLSAEDISGRSKGVISVRRKEMEHMKARKKMMTFPKMHRSPTISSTSILVVQDPPQVWKRQRIHGVHHVLTHLQSLQLHCPMGCETVPQHDQKGSSNLQTSCDKYSAVRCIRSAICIFSSPPQTQDTNRTSYPAITHTQFLENN